MPALCPPFLLTEGSQGCPSSSWQAHLASGRPHWEAMKAASLWPLPGHMPAAGRNRANESLPTAPPRGSLPGRFSPSLEGQACGSGPCSRSHLARKQGD